MDTALFSKARHLVSKDDHNFIFNIDLVVVVIVQVFGCGSVTYNTTGPLTEPEEEKLMGRKSSCSFSSVLEFPF